MLLNKSLVRAKAYSLGCLYLFFDIRLNSIIMEKALWLLRRTLIDKSGGVHNI